MPIALIVVDTLSQTLGAGRENTDDLATYVRFWAALAKELACCVLIIHHRPKDGIGKEPRGHSSLSATADTVLVAEGRITRKLSITKQRDGEEGPLCTFHLKPVPVGCNSRGDDVRSCVVDLQRSDQSQKPKSQVRGAQLSEHAEIVFEALRDSLATMGEETPLALRRAARDCPDTVVRLEAFLDKASECVRTRPDTKPDTIRKRVRRGQKCLQDLGKIEIWEKFVWPVG